MLLQEPLDSRVSPGGSANTRLARRSLVRRAWANHLRAALDQAAEKRATFVKKTLVAAEIAGVSAKITDFTATIMTES